MEYETPIDSLRPINTSDKEIDQNSILDYNDILKGLDNDNPNQLMSSQEHNQQQRQQQHHHHHQQQQQQQQQQQNQRYQQQQYQQYQHQQQQYQQHPQYQQHRIYQRQLMDDQTNIKSIFENQEYNDYIFVTILISIIFSEPIQKNLMTMMPGLYKNDKMTFVGTILQAVGVAFGLYLTKRIKFIQ